MASYSVHSRLGGTADDVIFVKDGFCWPAFAFTVLWCLWNRMWVTAAAVFAILAAIAVAGDLLGLGDVLRAVLTAAAGLILGFEAGELRRLSLAAAGYREHGRVSGEDLEEAEFRYFASAVRPEPPSDDLPPKLRPAAGHDPLGLFGPA